MDTLPLILAGDLLVTEDVREIRSPYDQRVVRRVAWGSASHVSRALDAAASAVSTVAQLPAHRRRAILVGARDLVQQRFDTFVSAIVDEAGKPVTAARGEVTRCLDTFDDAIHVTTSSPGHLEAMDTFAAGEGRVGLVFRVPVGVVSAITPFNFPLNLVAHKLLPAVATGCPILLKPAPQTPTAALLLGQALLEAGWPSEALSVLPVDVADATPLVADPRVRLLTFTGSAKVGWQIKQQATRARVALELGGNAGTYLAADADLDLAVERVVAGAFGYAGQTCISVQRVLVHRSIHDVFFDRLISRVRALPWGDPSDPQTVVGPLIRATDADRVQRWVEEARSQGATLHCGGERSGNLLAPMVLTGVSPHAQVWCDEVFGPVVSVAPVDSDDEALRLLDDTPYGLQAGLFTQRVDLVLRAARELTVGGLIHNDGSAFRVDSMPYGGSRDSGLGREGPRHALADFTETRTVVLRA